MNESDYDFEEAVEEITQQRLPNQSLIFIHNGQQSNFRKLEVQDGRDTGLIIGDDGEGVHYELHTDDIDEIWLYEEGEGVTKRFVEEDDE